MARSADHCVVRFVHFRNSVVLREYAGALFSICLLHLFSDVFISFPHFRVFTVIRAVEGQITRICFAEPVARRQGSTEDAEDSFCELWQGRVSAQLSRWIGLRCAESCLASFLVPHSEKRDKKMPRGVLARRLECFLVPLGALQALRLVGTRKACVLRVSTLSAAASQVCASVSFFTVVWCGSWSVASFLALAC